MENLVVGKWNGEVVVNVEEVNGKWVYTLKAHGQVITKKLSKHYKYAMVAMDNGKFKLHHNHMDSKQLINKYYNIENLYSEIAVIKYY